MKTKLLSLLFGMLAVITFSTGCVIHEHSHSRPRHHHHSQYHAHVHGPGCGHAMRGGVWIAIP